MSSSPDRQASGKQSTSNGSDETPTVTRREFLVAAGLAPALVGLAAKSGAQIAGGFVEDDSRVGHAVRDGTMATNARERRRVSVAIVGGGIGGLSAGWRLDSHGQRDWLLLELADQPGGNARHGENEAGKFPWGAHYLPVPGPEATHVRALLREFGVLDAEGRFDERTLCHSPQERLWQHGRFHEGLAPLDALSSNERAQFARFQSMMHEWRQTGAFTVPSALGHAHRRDGTLARQRAADVEALDQGSADAWLRTHGFTSPALRWWVEYATRDDFGASLSQASAWAAVHYFAARDPEDEGPLTWPEGNGWLVERLAARAGNRIVTRAPAVHIERTSGRWRVHTPTLEVECDSVIWAAPLFILPRVLPQVTLPVTIDYAPWVVANLTLRRPPEERGAPQAWDSVIYGSASLGYVDAGHQSLATQSPRRVWTWYHAVVDRSGADGRRWLQQQPWTMWRDLITADLRRAHPDIDECIERIDVRRWGHAMARPTPGLLARVEQLRTWTPAPAFHLAHADLSGMSLFEEAQWHGITAADRIAQRGR